MAKRDTPHATARAGWLSGPVPVVLLIACHLVLGMTAVARKSMTFDESAHLGGGLSYWTTNDYRLHSENGNWSQRFGALPLYLRGSQVSLDDPAWATSDVWKVTERLMAELGRDTDGILLRCRAMMAIPSALLALLVYLWSRRIFGAVGGLISLALYAFSPAMLANGFLVTSDLPATFFFTASSAAVWALLHRVSCLTLVAALVSLSGLVLSKYSGLLIIPMALAMVAVRLTRATPLQIPLLTRHEINGRPRQSLVFAAIAIVQFLGVVLLVWASYGFRYSMFAPPYEEGSAYAETWEQLEAKDQSPRLRSIVRFARDHQLLPEPYLYGFSYALRYSKDRVGFLNGVFSDRGWSSFFPLCLLWKTPLALFAVLILGVAALVVRARGADQRSSDSAPARATILYELTPIAALFGVYWIVALSTPLNIGHRHILPTYPPMFIFAGAAGLWFSVAAARSTAPTATGRGQVASRATPAGNSKVATTARGATIALLAVSALETVSFWPHYLAYFNVVAGGPKHAYRHLVDSSLDWGQDLGELKRWLDAHPEDSRDPQRVYLSYFGTALPATYGIRAQELPKYFPKQTGSIPAPLTGGLYCISASMLQSVYAVPYLGRWNEIFEHDYQNLRQVVTPFQRAAHDPAALKQMFDMAPPAAIVQRGFNNYRVLCFARLCSCLRQREPDDQVGYSIMIYRLSDADVAAALDGDPCELLPRPEGTPTEPAATNEARQ
ncbi:MAG TPA: glycosyltransferase family 39 protein [Pirellulales bacterium]|nr:glycosyltransferase family 39 protein [Pirellulales bacterium]